MPLTGAAMSRLLLTSSDGNDSLAEARSICSRGCSVCPRGPTVFRGCSAVVAVPCAGLFAEEAAKGRHSHVALVGGRVACVSSLVTFMCGREDGTDRVLAFCDGDLASPSCGFS